MESGHDLDIDSPPGEEDLALVVAAFGVYAFVRGRRQLGVFITAIGVTAFGLLAGVVVPAFSGGIYPHWSYGELGPGPWSALRYVVMHPVATLHVMVSPKTKLGLLTWVFVPGALLSLVSPIVILAVPLLLERILSERPNVWSTAFQYSAPLAPITAWLLSTVCGARCAGVGTMEERRPLAAWL